MMLSYVYVLLLLGQKRHYLKFVCALCKVQKIYGQIRVFLL